MTYRVEDRTTVLLVLLRDLAAIRPNRRLAPHHGHIVRDMGLASSATEYPRLVGVDGGAVARRSVGGNVGRSFLARIRAVGADPRDDGAPGAIQITRATRDLLPDEFRVEPLGTIDVKGKGPMEAWRVVGVKSS